MDAGVGHTETGSPGASDAFHIEWIGFSKHPFPVTPDEGAYYFSGRLAATFSEVMLFLRMRRGFVLITGDVGVGKTTFTRLLLHRLDEQGCRTALILNTFLQDSALLKSIVNDFGVSCEGDSVDVMLPRLHAFLLEQFGQGRNCVLIVDDAQSLTPSSLELLRQLSNLETAKDKLLQIVLVAQPEIVQTLQEHSLRQVRSRIALQSEILPFTLKELDAYLHHRLRVAGNSNAFQITPAALRLMARGTRGFPRTAHLVVDRCLFGLADTGERVIDRALMRRALTETGVLPAFGKRRVWLGVAAGVLAAAMVAVVAMPSGTIRATAQNAPQTDVTVPAARPWPEAVTPVPAVAPPAQTAAEKAVVSVTEKAVAPVSEQGAVALRESNTQKNTSVTPEAWLRFVQAYPPLASAPPPIPVPGKSFDMQLAELGLLTVPQGWQPVLLDINGREACARFPVLPVVSGSSQALLTFVSTRIPAQPTEFGRFSASVRVAQVLLGGVGLIDAVKVDGMIGPMTELALLRYQRLRGIPPSGQFDSLTAQSLTCELFHASR